MIRKEIGIGLIGSGFMGRAHAHAFRSAPAVFDLPAVPRLEMLADADLPSARTAAAALGFARATDDWKALVADPAVELVSIAAPNRFHKKMALAAIAAGKAVFCEKPLAPNARESLELVEAAEAAGVLNIIAFNYLKSPMIRLAREIIDGGEIGEVIGYRGWHFENYMGDPDAAWSWRLDEKEGDGVTADLMSHVVATARYLVGPIKGLVAHRGIVWKQRRGKGGKPYCAKVPDVTRAIIHFPGDFHGTLEASWTATGRDMQHAFEVTGTKGAVTLDFERLNELRLYRSDAPAGRAGFTTILSGPDHPDYANFTPAPGHQLGFSEIKTIEIAHLVRAMVGEAPATPDFREGWEVQRVIDAMAMSTIKARWISLVGSHYH